MPVQKVNGYCLYCEKYTELERSHTINRTFFKRLLKACGPTNAAKEVKLSSTIIRNSNDNWTDHMLCKSCESYFNQHFDAYGAKSLRGDISSIIITETKKHIFYVNINTTKIILYILTLYWRGAKSKHPSYDLLVTTENIHQNLKICFQERKWDYSHIQIKVSILYDGLNALNNEKVKQMIAAPFRRLNLETKTFSFFFIFEGFFIQMHFGKMPYALKKSGDWLNSKLNTIKCNKVNIHDIKEIQDVVEHMLATKTSQN